MTKRIKKKLTKRLFCPHYSEYKFRKRVYEYGIKHGGHWFHEWYVEGKHRSEEHMNGTGFDALIVTTSKSGKQIRNMQIATGCFPSSYTGDNIQQHQPEQTVNFTAHFHNGEMTDLESDWVKWLKGLE